MGTWTPGPGATTGDDTFTGDGTNEFASGGDGNDTLLGNDGDDSLNGGNGVDILDGGEGNDSLTDTQGGGGVADINGGAGDDLIFVSGGTSTFSGGVIDGGDGTDEITIYNNITSAGLTIQNVEILNTATQLVRATAEQFEAFDTIRVSSGNLTQGVTLTLTDAGIVDLTDELLGRGVTFGGSSGNDTITTSNGNDNINGNEGDDVLNSGDGNDTLTGGAGDDSYFAGAGNDTINDTSVTGTVSIDAGDDDDTINVSSSQYTTGTIDGGAGSDQLNAFNTTFGAVAIQNVEFLNASSVAVTMTAAQFESFDTIRYNGLNLTLSVSLTLSEAGVVDLADELLGRAVNFTGSAGDDTITTSEGNDTINGQDGADVLNGGLGNDNLTGGNGDDELHGGDGNDNLNDFASDNGVAAIYGEDGDDTIVMNNLETGGFTSGIVDGGAGNDQVQAYGALGAVTFQSVESLNVTNILTTATAEQFESFDTIRYNQSSLGSTVFLGLSAAGSVNLEDELLGRAAQFGGSSGNDSIRLSTSSDTIHGNDGDDTLFGGLGNDNLYGDAGLDFVYGEDGNDHIFLSVADFAAGEIYDGGAGTDRMLFTGIGVWDLRLATVNSIEWIYFSGGSAGNVHQLELNADQIGSGISLTAAIDGDNLTDDQITIYMQTPGSIDLSGWTFNAWSLNDTIDRVIVEGSVGADQIVGSRSDDALTGGGGDDILEGGRGNDVINGGAGIDTASYASASIGVIVGLTNFATYNTVGAGIDVIIDVENLLGSDHNDTLSGNALANTLTGAGGNDFLFGLDGADTLIGGVGADTLDGGSGADVMSGGDGDDTYVVDDAGDVTTELADEGTDTVQAAVTRTLGANLENLILTGAAAITGYGNILNNAITGNSAANQLYGFDGNDILDGGAGADNMFGGNGDDTYYVDNAGDQTTEVSALGGIDTVISSVSRNLTAHIENLTLTGSANLTASGNSLNNTLTGNSGNNILYGYDGNDILNGGAGADTMFGGASGNDYYYVDNAGDITVEGVAGPAGGFDTVVKPDQPQPERQP
ncbi:MAG: hypothetical protein R3C30_06325 [Hyphomonadaceae bacterium]